MCVFVFVCMCACVRACVRVGAWARAIQKRVHFGRPADGTYLFLLHFWATDLPSIIDIEATSRDTSRFFSCHGLRALENDYCEVQRQYLKS